MQDEQIIALYWQREPDAIRESQSKYGAYCFAVAKNILNSAQDCEECVSDTWLRAWNAIPPSRPKILKMFLAKITRRLSIDRCKALNAQKRGSGEPVAVWYKCGRCGYGTGAGPEHQPICGNAFGAGTKAFCAPILFHRFHRGNCAAVWNQPKQCADDLVPHPQKTKGVFAK